MNNMMDRPVTMAEIGAKLGKSRGCVAFYLSKNNLNMQTPTAILIRNTAKEMGYDRKVARTYGGFHSWYNGNFKTREEEVARMKELRAKGYSNPEIAKAIGRTTITVLRAIGKQDPELAKQNRIMSAHIRAQKNAARKQFVLNKPIREYNAKVEKHNKMKAELNLLQTELLTEKPEIMKAAQTKIDFPMVDLHTVQPTALQ